MPISTDSAKVSIDFVYEWETLNGDKVVYNMRLIHNEDGPVILIFNGGEVPIELPAIMFSEVAEFLVRQGAIRGISTPVSVGRNVALPSITRRAKDPEPIAKKIGQRVPRPESIPVEPVASFTQPQEEDEGEGDEGDEVETVETQEMTVDAAAGIRDAMRNRAQVNIEKMKEKKIKQK